MMDSSRCSDVLGRDCPHFEEHVAHSCQLRGDGSWNKWRGPALRGEVAVYAAKAHRPSIDQRARRGKLPRVSNPALLVPFLLLLTADHGQRSAGAHWCVPPATPAAPFCTSTARHALLGGS